MRIRALLIILPMLTAAGPPKALATPITSVQPGTVTAAKYQASTRVVFHSSRDNGRWQVYVSDLDGTHALNLSNSTAHESYPDVSPDGNAVVFESYPADGTADNTELMRVGIDGKSRTQLTHSGAGHFAEGGAWSPDGTRIAFALGVAGQSTSDIYTMSATGTAPLQITHGGNNYSPAWTPDGRIVFVRDAPGGSAMSIMDASGSAVHDLYSAPRLYDPAVSPDGRSIVFARRTTPGDGPFATEVVVIGVDGHNPSPLTAPTQNAGEARFSPDGSQIVFDCARNPSGITPPPDGPYDLCATSTAGGASHTLFTSPGDSFAPQLLPVLAPVASPMPQPGAAPAPAATPGSFPWWLLAISIAVVVFLVGVIFGRRRDRAGDQPSAP